MHSVLDFSASISLRSPKAHIPTHFFLGVVQSGDDERYKKVMGLLAMATAMVTMVKAMAMAKTW